MEQSNSGGSANFGFGKPKTTNDEQKDINANSPVEDTITIDSNSNVTNERDNESEDVLNSPYTDERSVTISLVKNFSLYRKANDKVLPKKSDYIGSSVNSSRVLSANKEEIEAYFPNLIGLAPNNADFIARIKQWLNNIRIQVDELGKSFNTSFVYHKKADYYKVKSAEEAIENDFLKVNRQDSKKFKEALKEKITKLNVLESSKHKLGYPVELEDYLMYRHCLLYGDVAKDLAQINSDPSIRFYFKDDKKEADKNRKFRNEVNKAKTNYVSCLADDVLFNSVYAQYLVLNSLPVIAGLAEDKLDREIKLDKFSTDEPIKFNKIFTNKDVKLIGNIELLIARGELQRSQYNQNISDTDGNFIGANISDAIVWFKHPDNISSVNAYMNKLKNI